MALRPKAAIKLTVGLALAVAAFLLAVKLMQSELLFPTHAVPAAGRLPPGAERLELETPDGEKIYGVHIPPRQSAGPPLLIVGFGGNAWNGQHVAEHLAGLFPEAHVVAFHYRGYAPSTGRPSAKALLEDAPLILDEAMQRIHPERLVVAGFSIGSGVAASLSSRNGVDGLILVTPFDSLKAVAGDLFPWLPVGPLFQHELAAADALQGSSAPVAIVAAERDDIVHPRRTAALRSRVPNLVFDRTINAAGHNDLYQLPEFETAMQEALQAIIAAKK
jgi:uncharacterized protein